MRRFLLFRLYGAFASWGDIAVGEVRPTAIHPSRSALLGLCGAALGLRRRDGESLTALAASLRFAVLVVRAGVPLRDYHTVQTASYQRGRLRLTRADQLRDPRHHLQTILSFRDYRCDALYDVAAWNESDTPAYSLDRLATALARPTFPLYLGRRACPPALPLAPRLVEAQDARSALDQNSLPVPTTPGDRAQRPIFHQIPGEPLGYFWEGDPESEGEAFEQVTVRRDDPVSPVRRIFHTRKEHFRPFAAPANSEDPDAP